MNKLIPASVSILRDVWIPHTISGKQLSYQDRQYCAQIIVRSRETQTRNKIQFDSIILDSIILLQTRDKWNGKDSNWLLFCAIDSLNKKSLYTVETYDWTTEQLNLLNSELKIRLGNHSSSY